MLADFSQHGWLGPPRLLKRLDSDCKRSRFEIDVFGSVNRNHTIHWNIGGFDLLGVPHEFRFSRASNHYRLVVGSLNDDLLAIELFQSSVKGSGQTLIGTRRVCGSRTASMGPGGLGQRRRQEKDARHAQESYGPHAAIVGESSIGDPTKRLVC